MKTDCLWRAMAGKAKCWNTTLTLHGLHKATPPRCRYQQEALGGDGAL